MKRQFTQGLLLVAFVASGCVNMDNPPEFGGVRANYGKSFGPPSIPGVQGPNGEGVPPYDPFNKGMVGNLYQAQSMMSKSRPLTYDEVMMMQYSGNGYWGLRPETLAALGGNIPPTMAPGRLQGGPPIMPRPQIPGMPPMPNGMSPVPGMMPPGAMPMPGGMPTPPGMPALPGMPNMPGGMPMPPGSLPTPGGKTPTGPSLLGSIPGMSGLMQTNYQPGMMPGGPGMMMPGGPGMMPGGPGMMMPGGPGMMPGGPGMMPGGPGMMMPGGPGMMPGGPGMMPGGGLMSASMPPGASPTGGIMPVQGVAGGPSYPAQRTQVFISRPANMKVFWFTQGPDGKPSYSQTPLETPGRYNFAQGAIYRLKLTHIPGRPALELYPTLEVVPTNAKTSEFLAHNAVPLEFTDEDFKQVVDRNYIVKVVYLPDPQHQDSSGSGPDEIVSTRLEPGMDPIQEALRRGSILLVIRIGNIDQGLQHSPSMSAVAPGGAPPNLTTPPGGGPPGSYTPQPRLGYPGGYQVPYNVNPVPPPGGQHQHMPKPPLAPGPLPPLPGQPGAEDPRFKLPDNDKPAPKLPVLPQPREVNPNDPMVPTVPIEPRQDEVKPPPGVGSPQILPAPPTPLDPEPTPPPATPTGPTLPPVPPTPSTGPTLPPTVPTEPTLPSIPMPTPTLPPATPVEPAPTLPSVPSGPALPSTSMPLLPTTPPIETNPSSDLPAIPAVPFGNNR